MLIEQTDTEPKGARQVDMHKKLAEVMGARLRELREERGWSQTELAQRAGIGQSRISDMERGRSWTVAHLAKFSALMEVEPSAFVASSASGAPPPGADYIRLSPSELLLIKTLREEGPKGAVMMLLPYLKSIPFPGID